MRRVTDISPRRHPSPDTKRRARHAKRAAPRAPARSAKRRTATPAKGLARAKTAVASERGSQQRIRLLHAASVVFARGFAQASVAAIVKTAGMSRRTFYEHFDDLTDALVQLYDAAAGVLLRAVDEASRNATTPREQLERAMDAYVMAIATNADLARIVYGEIHAAGPDHALRHQATLARFAALLRNWSEGARAARLLRQVPDDFTLYAIIHGIEGVAMRYVYSGEERRLAEAGPRLVAFVLSALT